MAHRDKPTHPRELIHHPWIDFIACRRAELELHHPEFGSYSLPALESRLQSDNLAMQADAIAKGRGIGLLPTWFANGFETAHPAASFLASTDGNHSQQKSTASIRSVVIHFGCAYLLMRSAKQGPMSGNKNPAAADFYHRFFFA